MGWEIHEGVVLSGLLRRSSKDDQLYVPLVCYAFWSSGLVGYVRVLRTWFRVCGFVSI
ncbi:hypothetical protein BU24DRAFT_425705 [Aaosphaeria arxii CBS 175.79]|uniref:Uncharacterized protein n=1 Tax=Aaosphaeria arxii CBS 175.79 TaxID=1450172 RepID=A0A6A5XFM2_9PLEO|nr:uncharacterized protein BU24DRAFT_425705 [Aaosphaeria arxii CBS 175.79]KAF2011882.1 hypothetical protein BU24DRAFT_425705 [Aaosphaeria arxii CBS 175.79]